MIPTTNAALFEEALRCLKAHKTSLGQGFKGRFIQIFLGLKFFQNNLPSMFSSSFVSTEVLQSLLDDLYAKMSRPATDCVLSLFEGGFLARTGLVGPGNTSSQNTWRNNFNIQKGIGCYAPATDLASPTFLDQERSECRYLSSSRAGHLDGAECSLCPGGKYRQESHRKWLRIDPGGSGYAVTDLMNIPNFTPYIAPSQRRIPIYPLLVAIYHDADPSLLGTRETVELADFMSAFNFSQAEFEAYFDDSTTNPQNLRLVNSSAWPAGASLGTPLPSRPLLIPGRLGTRRRRTRAIPATPVLLGTPAPPPAVNSGWEAEHFVAAALEAAGWKAYVVSRQQLGYDVFAQKGDEKRYVEVKSSMGPCAPVLTAREWQQASFHSDSYVLAVIENFRPADQNTIHWIPDPANRCVASPQTTISHCIPRASWTIATILISAL